jgi:hypothetical protein
MGSPECASPEPISVITVEDVCPCAPGVKREVDGITSVRTAEAISCKDD